MGHSPSHNRGYRMKWSRDNESGHDLPAPPLDSFMKRWPRLLHLAQDHSQSRRNEITSARIAAVSMCPVACRDNRHASGIPASAYTSRSSPSIRSSPSGGVSAS